MGERYLEVNGTRLFLDLRGDPAAPPLLFVHGGPGISCHGFMTAMGDRLAERLYVVGLDQRGVLRSDPLADGEVLTEDVLVADCEAVRAELGIARWTVLGHSFGGRVALRYAVRHPDRVAAVIFENPCWDFDETERLRLPAAAAIYDELGDPGAAAHCRGLAARPDRFTDWRETVELVGGLQRHDRYDDLYFVSPAARGRWNDIEATPFPDAQRSRARAHAEQALDGCFEPLQALLPDIAVPADLIIGRHDLVCGPRQIEAFRNGVPRGRVHEFLQAGHFVVLEEPERFADLVISATDCGHERFTSLL